MMAQRSVESKKEEILGKLREAGTSGLTRGGLGIRGAGNPGAQALVSLEAERRIGNLGTLKKPRYVLMEFYRPLELACDRIEMNAKKAGPSQSETLELLSKRELEKGCEGEIRKKSDEAIHWLVRERKILRFKRARVSYYVHAVHVKNMIPGDEASRIEGQEPQHFQPVLEGAKVLNAYHRAKGRLGYSNVEISELRNELNESMDLVKAFLLEEARRGNAILSLGDWSLSSEEVRSGAIELFGKPHLLVKFIDPQV